VEAFLEAGRLQDRTFEKLLDLVEAQPDLRIVMVHFAAVAIRCGIFMLGFVPLELGTGKKDIYVAASSLLFATTLDYLFAESERGRLS